MLCLTKFIQLLRHAGAAFQCLYGVLGTLALCTPNNIVQFNLRTGLSFIDAVLCETAFMRIQQFCAVTSAIVPTPSSIYPVIQSSQWKIWLRLDEGRLEFDALVK